MELQYYRLGSSRTRAGKKSAPGEPIVNIFHGKEVTGLVMESRCGFGVLETGDYVWKNFRSAVGQVFPLAEGSASSNTQSHAASESKVRRIS